MMQLTGTRVLRGPDWPGGDSDGGEGYLGTVVGRLPDEHVVRVLWDMGQESTCSTGQGGRFDLSVFDSAPIGIRHPGTQCAECGEKEVYGTLWRCQLCSPSVDLCSLCYSDDRHDTRHPFLRIDTPNATGQPQPKRKISVKVRSIGLHPGAKVVRGKDWAWGNQDGGQGSEGEVLGHEDAPGAPRSLLRVKWPNGSTHNYRLGVGGKMDLTCVEEEVGAFYYRDHLPLLDTTETSTLLARDTDGTVGTPDPAPHPSTPSTTVPQVPSTPSTPVPQAPSTYTTSEITHFAHGTIPEAARSSTEAEAEAEVLGEGDRVAIKVDEDELQELQKDSGGCTARMLRCIGRTGTVTAISAKGMVAVKFSGSKAKISYRFNPKALLKVTHSFSENDLVRIRNDLRLLRILNQRVGWKSAMDKTVNQVGRVKKVDEDDDLRVDFGGAQYVFAPACCLPVPPGTATPQETLPPSPFVSSLGAAGSTKRDSGDGEETDYRKLFRQLRDLGPSEGRKSVRSLFGAIEDDDSDLVRRMCKQDPSMVEREHQGITPLIYTCLRGRWACAVALLDHGADVNRHAEDDYRKTPLSAIAEGKSEEMAEVLLSRGADTTWKYGDGHTLAHLCVLRNKKVVMQLLVKHGADLNVKDDSGHTPLHLAMALKGRRQEVMEVLVAAPCVDVHQRIDEGDFDPIQWAAYINNTRAMELLLARDCSQVERLRQGHSTALHIAATNDHVDCVRLLILQGGANINARQKRTNMTALMVASHSARLQTVEALLELGADVNLCDRDGDTALHSAIGGKVDGKRDPRELVIAHRVQIANLLISNGAYVDILNRQGRNPFAEGSRDVRHGVQAFIKNNQDVVRLKRQETDKLLQSLGVSSLGSQSPGQLREALKGIRLPCGLCGASKSDVTLRPCAHRCVCRACSVKVTRCPLCDEEVREKEVCVE